MIADLTPNSSREASPPTGLDSDQQREWFAYALPAAMALLLALVPLIGRAAAGPFLLVLVPLILWSAFRDTERAVYLFIAWCWMDGTLRGLLGDNPAVTLGRDIVLLLVTVGWAIQRLGTLHTDRWRTPPGTLLLVLFAVNAFLQIFNPFSLGLTQSLGGLKVHLLPPILFFITYDVFRRPGQVRSLFLFLTLATIVISLVSIVQYSHGKEWTFAHFPGTKEAISTNFNPSAGSKLSQDDIFKPPGTTGFGGATAAFAGFVFPLTFVLVLLSQRMKFSIVMRAVFGVILFGFIITFFVNGLRSALVEAAVSVAACGLFVGGRTRVRVLVAVGLCFALALIGWGSSQALTHGASADRYGSLFANPQKALHEDRQSFFDQAGEIITRSPMGVGLGRTGAVAGHFGTSSKDIGFVAFSEAYLGNMIFETGIIGATLISLVAISFLVRGGMIIPKLEASDDKLLAGALFSILFIMFLNFFIVSVLVIPPGSVLFWLLGAVLLRVYMLPPDSPLRPLRGRISEKA